MRCHRTFDLRHGRLLLLSTLSPGVVAWFSRSLAVLATRAVHFLGTAWVRVARLDYDGLRLPVAGVELPPELFPQPFLG